MPSPPSLSVMRSADSLGAGLASLKSHFLKTQLDPRVWIRLRFTEEVLETLVCLCSPGMAISGIRCDPKASSPVHMDPMLSRCHPRDTSTCLVWCPVTTSGWKQTPMEAGNGLNTAMLP